MANVVVGPTGISEEAMEQALPAFLYAHDNPHEIPMTGWIIAWKTPEGDVQIRHSDKTEDRKWVTATLDIAHSRNLRSVLASEDVERLIRFKLQVAAHPWVSVEFNLDDTGGLIVMSHRNAHDTQHIAAALWRALFPERDTGPTS